MAEYPRTRFKLSDVARLAGVGKATASRVLNGGKNVSEETAKRVEDVIRSLGYQPNHAARSLKGASSGIVGMIVPSISDMFFSRCAEAVEKVVRKNGGMLIVAASHDEPRAVLESFQQLMLHQMDGLILVQTALQETALLEELKHATIPVVGIDRPLVDTRFSSVLCENYAGARAATEHLLGHGYRTISHLQVMSKLYTMRERRRGYTAAMRQAQLVPRNEGVRDAASTRRALERGLAEATGPLAILAGNNLTARYVLEAVVAMGLRIPDQVAVLSFDDFDLADSMTPPMSVVQQPIQEIGERAATLLFEQMRAVAAPAQVEVMLPTRLVLRGSCGCCGEVS